MKFIKLKEQIVSVDSIQKVESPRKFGTGIEWSIRTLLNSAEPVINSVYSSELEARSEYERIAKQLCADKD